MTPRERLTEILNFKVVDSLIQNGFKFSEAKSQFNRTINNIKHIIYFDGSKWNYSDAVADYNLYCKIEVKQYPKWYLENYNTTQSNHPQVKVSEKSIHPPSLQINYKDHWDISAQENQRYDLLKFTKQKIGESIYHNIANSILPCLNNLSSYSAMADNIINPLDAFDFYMMDNNRESAKLKLIDIIDKITKLKIEEVDLNDEFVKESINNTIKMTNIRINKFFPEFDKAKSKLTT